MKKTKKPRQRTYDYSYYSGTKGMAKTVPVATLKNRVINWGYDTVTGVTLQDYKGRIQQCKDAGTPLNASFGTRTIDSAHYLFRASVTSKCHSGTFQWQDFGSSAPSVPDAFALLSYPSADAIRANQELTNKFAAKVRERMQSVSGPTFLGEIREALELVRKPGKAIERLWKRFLKRSKKRIKKNPRPKNENHLAKWHKWFVDKYLEFTFGIQPLLSDVDGAIKALAEFQFLPNVYIFAESKGPSVARRDVTTSTGFYYSVLRESEYSVRGAGAIRQDVLMPVSTLNALRRKLGFSWTEAVPTVWELTPFSFVIDYFTNVGDVLNAGYASTAYLGWTSVTARTKQIRFTAIEPRAQYAPPNGGACEYVSKQDRLLRLPGSDDLTLVTLSRSKSLYQLKMQWEFPKPKQWFNLAALASSLGEFQKLYSSR